MSGKYVTMVSDDSIEPWHCKITDASDKVVIYEGPCSDAPTPAEATGGHIYMHTITCQALADAAEEAGQPLSPPIVLQ